jgi:hypothetical protein
VYPSGVTQATVREDFEATGRGLLCPILDVKGQDRGELRHREWVVAPDTADLGDQAAGAGRDANTGHQADQGGGLADDGEVESAVSGGDD